uniref:Uncharacterized protein n=1 Tax=Populus trichocarpa TaxID=3694 RepID=B9N632_POPTR
MTDTFLTSRFLYPINPFVCVAASAVIGSFPDLFQDKYNPQDSSWLVLAYKILEHHDDVGKVWWIDDGFRGLLPLPFNSTLSGTASAPPYFNNKNSSEILKLALSLLSCSLIDLTLLVEVTCQLGS